MANFSVDFWILAVKTGWEEKALRGAFPNSLNEGLKRELATKELSKTLEALVNMCIRLDDHMREYGRRPWETRRAGGGPSTWTGSFSSSGERVEPEPQEEEEPMQLGRPRVSAVE